ncbi:unnamed protein product, partial [Oppiella nova]
MNNWRQTVGIIYYPDNNYTNSLMNSVRNQLRTELYRDIHLLGVNSDQELQSLLKKSIKTEYYEEIYYNIKYVFGVSFTMDDKGAIEGRPPKHLNYKITVYDNHFENGDTYLYPFPSVTLLNKMQSRGKPILEHIGLESLSCLLPTNVLFWFIHICVGLELNANSGADWVHKLISIKKLSKTYKSMIGLKRENILKDIDLDVDNNTIAVILGPNGSGKTTLINIITGLLDFEGKVTIGGHDITRETQLARNECGICPQNNVYFKYLTIRDHLMIFSQLKQTIRQSNDGYSGQQLIQWLDLEEELNKEAYHLSGGTLRRLVLAMAFVGRNRTLILDEPTAALDPRVRRKVWDLIIDSRKTKSLLITSHDFEEANKLSDQIYIISEGKVCFNGSPLEMKNQFNSGYHLKIKKSIEFQTENKMTEIIGKSVEIKSLVKNELTDNEELVYELNFEDSPRFGKMFEDLEQNESILAINDISLSMTTLEASYEKIVSKHDNKSIDNFSNNNELTIDENNDNLLNTQSLNIQSKHNSYLNLVLSQIHGITVKRFNYLCRHFTQLFTLIIIPVIFIAMIFITIDILFALKKSYNYRTEIDLKSDTIYGNGMKGYAQVLIDNDIIQEDLGSDYHKNIQPSLLEYSGHSLLNYFQNLLFGVSANITNNNTVSMSMHIWHNYYAYHSLPISLNLMTNALIKYLTQDNDYEISVSNKPLMIDWKGRDVNEYHDREQTKDISIATDYIVFLCIFSFTSAAYVLQPLTEWRTRFKLIQFMSGLNPTLYWVSNFVFDFTIHSICSAVYVSIYYMFDTNQLLIGTEYSAISLYLSFMSYGMAFIPFAYLVSFMFSKPSTGFTFISLYNIIAGTVTTFHKTIVKLFKKLWSLKNILANRDTNDIELQEVSECPPDVREERERVSQVIRSGDFESYSLIIDKLTKRLNKRTVMPNGVSFVVKRAECMGLLGLNGSGKTSLFR